MNLKQRIEKLEGRLGGIVVIVFPDGLSREEEHAYTQEELRARGLPPDTRYVPFSEADTKL